MPEFSPYAWVIDKDHLDGPGGEFYNATKPADCVGTAGPSEANGETKDEFLKNYQHHHQFRMYDDDAILYVTGTLFWNGDADSPDSDTDDYMYGPLRDYGEPAMGCVTVKYTGKPEWDCG